MTGILYRLGVTAHCSGNWKKLSNIQTQSGQVMLSILISCVESCPVTLYNAYSHLLWLIKVTKLWFLQSWKVKISLCMLRGEGSPYSFASLSSTLANGCSGAQSRRSTCAQPSTDCTDHSAIWAASLLRFWAFEESGDFYPSRKRG